MTLGPRQLDMLGALGRKRANSLLKRRLIYVEEVMRSSGHVHLTDTGRKVIFVSQDKAH